MTETPPHQRHAIVAVNLTKNKRIRGTRLLSSSDSERWRFPYGQPIFRIKVPESGPLMARVVHLRRSSCHAISGPFSVPMSRNRSFLKWCFQDRVFSYLACESSVDGGSSSSLETRVATFSCMGAHTRLGSLVAGCMLGKPSGANLGFRVQGAPRR